MRSADDWLKLLHEVPDPEIPVLNVVEMGIVRTVESNDASVEVKITPTYMGCPAMDAIADDIRAQLSPLASQEGRSLSVELVYAPAWTTDWLSDSAKAKLEAYGIAPPGKTTDKRALNGEAPTVRCPKCKSEATELISLFGSTACKAHYRCNDCAEPFDHFKCI
ncbi:MAG: phenylacetate-CoA oxygenase subunit PaaJ [Flavobacteriales bacterium]|nr:phenylacetate-CoA oxygenase subunit PaaJ [Flavobacteriales bacterium]